jgi:pSer/pThr/pTyr-binding forkhead associated (FHA) protein
MFISLDDDGETRYPVSKDMATIGRSWKSDIRIQSVFVSRTHARLREENSRLVIEDAGSKNGILVNSEPTGRCVLRDGDIVSLGGKLSLKFVERADV